MPDSIEVSAKTVRDATEQAARRLGVPVSDLEVEVLSEGRAGFIGIGAEDARIRASVRGASLGAAPIDDDPDFGDYEEEEEEVAVVATVEASHPAGAVAATELEHEAQVMLQGLLQRMRMRAEVEVVPIDPLAPGATDAAAPQATLNIIGYDVTQLIGRRGENLSSIQFLLNLMLSRKLKRQTRVQVDVDSYRVRREESLRNLAERMAERVKLSGQPMALEAMPAKERRIVHLTLSEHPDVTTESTGEGDHRKVVIYPR